MRRTVIISIVLSFLCCEVPASNVLDSISDTILTVPLKEVHIIAKRVYRDKDHISIIPDSHQIKHSETGYALLQNLMIPGISIEENGLIKAMGNTASVYVNGQPAEVHDIQNIHPSDVIRIEYYDMPEGKYSKDAAAINFVLRQYKSGGYIQAMGGQAVGIDNGEYNLSSSISKGKNIYSVFAGYEYYSHGDNLILSKENYNLSNIQIYRNSSSFQQDRKHTGYAQFQLSHRANKSYWTGKFTFVGIKSPRHKTYGEVVTDQTETNSFLSYSADRSYSPKVDLNGDIHLSKNAILSLGVHARFLDNGNDYSYEESTYNYSINCNEKVKSLNAGAIYTVKHKGNTYTAELFDYYNNYKTNYNSDIVLTKHLWKNEALAFVSGNFSINKNLSFTTRLGIDCYQYHLTGSKQFNQLSPRLNLRTNYQLNNNALQWSFMYVNSNYEMGTVNDAPISVNKFLIKQGNPNINKSYDIESSVYYSGRYKILNMSAFIRYSYSHNPVSYNYAQNDNYIVQSFENDGYNQDLFAMLAIGLRLPHSLSIVNSLSFKRTDILLAEHWTHNNITAGIKLQWLYKYWNFMSGIAFAQSELNRYSLEIVKQPLNYNFKVSYSKNNLLMSLTAYAPFYNRHLKKETVAKYYESHSDILNHRYYNYCELSISYTFNFGKHIPIVQRNIDERVESSMLQRK